MNPFAAAGRLVRRMVFRAATGRWSSWFRWVVPGRIDYAREVGDPLDNSIVAATLLWIARTFPEAPPILDRLDLENGQEEVVRDHAMLRLLRRPNDYYSGVTLWMATVVDFNAWGDAYWIIIPSAAGLPAQLWWAPSWSMEPKGDENTFVSHYEYTVNGDTTRLPPEQVVHFRYGLDPENDRKGLSPLRAVLKEVFTDNEAAAFTATILRNMGVPGIVISPDKGESVSDEDADMTKAVVQEKTTGDRRGEPIVMTGATKVEQFGFNPQQLLLKELRRVPEERVTAITGIPAMVVGLGAGLDRSTFTNMGEARASAYEAGLIPMQRILAEEVLFQLLVLYEGQDGVFKWRYRFDLTQVRVLQEDLFRVAQRHDLMIRGGWEQVEEGRRAMGLPIDPNGGDKIYLRGWHTTQVPADGGEPQPLGPGSGPAPSQGAPVANGNGNGNGWHMDAEAAHSIADAVLAGLERKELSDQGAKR